MNSKDIKTYNLPQDKQVLYHLEVKPYFFLATLMFVGFIIVMFQATIGLILISISSYAIMFLPSRVLLEFTRTYLVMHNKASHNDCVMIYYEDILSWQYISGYKADELVIELVDGTKESIECFNKRYVTKCMNDFVKNKEIVVRRKNI